MKYFFILICWLFAVQTTWAQTLQINSSIHAKAEKVTIYQEWPERVLIDTPFIKNGKLNYHLPKNKNVVYSIKLRKPFVNEYVFADETPINISITKDTQVFVKGNVHQQKLKTFEQQLAPLEKQWNTLGLQYSNTTNVDEKVVLNKKINAVANKVQQQRLLFALNNKNNLAGAWLAYNYLFAWNPTSIEKLLPAFKKINWAKTTYLGLLKKQEDLEKLSMKGLQAPSFQLRSIDGNMVLLDSIIKKNKYVLVDFWASWCTPCRAGNRKMAPLYDAFRKKGIEIVSISLDEQESLWKAAVVADKIPWIQLIAPDALNGNTAKAYKVKSLPATYLINKEGEIILQNVEVEDLKKL